MGRAYEVRKASIQKTGAQKGKLYTTFAKEIYLVMALKSDNTLTGWLSSVKTAALKHENTHIVPKLCSGRRNGASNRSF